MLNFVSFVLASQELRYLINSLCKTPADKLLVWGIILYCDPSQIAKIQTRGTVEQRSFATVLK